MSGFRRKINLSLDILISSRSTKSKKRRTRRGNNNYFWAAAECCRVTITCVARRGLSRLVDSPLESLDIVSPEAQTARGRFDILQLVLERCRRDRLTYFQKNLVTDVSSTMTTKLWEVFADSMGFPRDEMTL